MLPISIVVDVLDRAGHGGGAVRIAGTQLFLELPLIGTLDSDHRDGDSYIPALGDAVDLADEFAVRRPDRCAACDRGARLAVARHS